MKKNIALKDCIKKLIFNQKLLLLIRKELKNQIKNSIFLFMFSALRFSALVGSILLLIFDFNCVWGITNVNPMGNWMVKCKNYLSLNKKDCHADGCFNLAAPYYIWQYQIFKMVMFSAHAFLKMLLWKHQMNMV